MKFEFPDTGEGVTEGKFLEWLVDEGDSVEEDQAVAEVETDKAVIDVPAPSDGVIKDLMAEPGDTVKVGEVILEIDTGEDVGEAEDDHQDEAPEEVEAHEGESSKEDKEKKESDDIVDSDEESSDRDILALPKVRKLAKDNNIDLAKLDVDGRITEEDVMSVSDETELSVEESEESGKVEQKEEEDEMEEDPAEEMDNPFENDTTSDSENSEVIATPATRKFARTQGVDISNIEGTGRGGKVTREDVKSAAEGSEPSSEKGHEKQNEKQSSESHPESEFETIEMSGIRKTVAEKMAKSKKKIPHVTHTDKADITELHEFRERKKGDVDVHLTYMPFIIKAVSQALKQHPRLNAELDEKNSEINRYKNHDFNMAVDTENGLMVPLISDVKNKNILELASDVIEKAEGARDRSLSGKEMRNGTFSITNIGAIGGGYFTPIISYPQVAILGIGTIEETAEVVDGEVKPRMTVKLSLSYDHRVVDGADAARFMNTVVENLEDPESMVLRL